MKSNKMSKEELAASIAEVIKLDVTDRRGWRQEWDMFDSDIKEEIITTWQRLILDKLNKQK